MSDCAQVNEILVTLRSGSLSEIVQQGLRDFVESKECGGTASRQERQRYCCKKEKVFDLNAEPGQYLARGIRYTTYVYALITGQAPILGSFWSFLYLTLFIGIPQRHLTFLTGIS